MARRHKQPPFVPVTAADVIEFIETVCFVPRRQVRRPAAQTAGVAEGYPAGDLRQSAWDPAGDRQHGEKKRQDNPGRVFAARALMRSAGQEPTELGIVLRRPIARPGRDPLCVGLEDGADEPAARANGAHPGNRQDAELWRARNAVSGAFRRGDDGLRSVAHELDPFSEEAIRAANPAGLDLSESADLTALVLAHCDPRDGVWHVRPIFWLPEERLAEKAARDRAPYDLWAEQGYLETTPGASISYEFIAERLKDVFEDYHVTKIAFDRWNYPHLRPWLVKVGFSEQLLERTFVEFGQGFKSMSPALRDLESLVLGRKLRHGNHPVLTMCMANATVERDAAGNRKLSKKRSSGRIDGAVALAMAIAAAPAAWTAKVDIAALIG
jgi:hypothetical protein